MYTYASHSGAIFTNNVREQNAIGGFAQKKTWLDSDGGPQVFPGVYDIWIIWLHLLKNPMKTSMKSPFCGPISPCSWGEHQPTVFFFFRGPTLLESPLQVWILVGNQRWKEVSCKLLQVDVVFTGCFVPLRTRGSRPAWIRCGLDVDWPYLSHL